MERPNERRKARRTSVTLPVRVRGLNTAGGKFEEITHSANVSSYGVVFSLKACVNQGARLELSLPLPRIMQKTTTPKEVYQSLAVVTRVEIEGEDGLCRTAVKFGNLKAKRYYRETTLDQLV